MSETNFVGSISQSLIYDIRIFLKKLESIQLCAGCLHAPLKINQQMSLVIVISYLVVSTNINVTMNKNLIAIMKLSYYSLVFKSIIY